MTKISAILLNASHLNSAEVATLLIGSPLKNNPTFLVKAGDVRVRWERFQSFCEQKFALAQEATARFMIYEESEWAERHLKLKSPTFIFQLNRYINGNSQEIDQPNKIVHV